MDPAFKLDEVRGLHADGQVDCGFGVVDKQRKSMLLKRWDVCKKCQC
jgi:hypothetical protein